jgi:hypothetical protein
MEIFEEYPAGNAICEVHIRLLQNFCHDPGWPAIPTRTSPLRSGCFPGRVGWGKTQQVRPVHHTPLTILRSETWNCRNGGRATSHPGRWP